MPLFDEAALTPSLSDICELKLITSCHMCTLPCFAIFAYINTNYLHLPQRVLWLRPTPAAHLQQGMGFVLSVPGVFGSPVSGEAVPRANEARETFLVLY